MRWRDGEGGEGDFAMSMSHVGFEDRGCVYTTVSVLSILNCIYVNINLRA